MSVRTSRHAELLKQLIATRENAGTTQEQLARRLKRDQSIIAKYESGARGIGALELIDISEAIGVSPQAIFHAVVGVATTSDDPRKDSELETSAQVISI